MGKDSRLKIDKRILSLFLMICLLILVPLQAQSKDNQTIGTIRVCLAQNLQTQVFSVQGQYRLVGSNGEVYAEVLPGEQWQADYLDGRLQLTRDGEIVGSYDGNIKLKQAGAKIALLGGSGVSKNATLEGNFSAISAGGQVSGLKSRGQIHVVSSSGTIALQGGGELNLVTLALNGRNQNYRGDMEFRAQAAGITLINELPVEEYLYGVVPREMPASWPKEAQKAQAVTARSYAVAQLGSYKSSGYDVLSTQMSQVYGGYNAEHPNASKAVNETQGQVLACNDKPISAFFHSSSGGYIENSQDIWLGELDYLKAKADPYDRNEAHYNWTVVYDHDQLISQLSQKKNLYIKQQPDRDFTIVQDIEVLEKTSTGARVKKIRITGQDASGETLMVDIYNADNVRSALGLKSSLFELTKVIDPEGKLAEIRLTGSGYGHGLGMSQYGALGMANQGYNYQEILKYYYSNTKIRNYSN